MTISKDHEKNIFYYLIKRIDKIEKYFEPVLFLSHLKKDEFEVNLLAICACIFQIHQCLKKNRENLNRYMIDYDVFSEFIRKIENSIHVVDDELLSLISRIFQQCKIIRLYSKNID